MNPTDPSRLLARFGTGATSDALDLLGIDGGLQGLRPVTVERSVSGPAFTLQFVEVEPGDPAPAAEFIDDVPAGSVVVIANAGRLHCTVWGGLLSRFAAGRGLAGTVIDGVCRDLDESAACGYPLWARGGYMKSGKNRVRLAAVQVPVEVCGTTVHPGDLVCADASGVVVVPSAVAADVAATAEQITVMEEQVLTMMLAGVPLREARSRAGYNKVAFRRSAQR
ncbi:RraA family protein [Kitasatospora sp. NPDC050543]|uniref:RraA family protein n=1 Tax=Kitasatospora sp. NPDC050543 TaxID=3364054 RepID=UPI003793C746